MRDCLAQLCGFGIVFGIALSLTPEGAVKRIMVLGCTAMLVLLALQSVKEIDHDDFSLQLARYRELGKTLTVDADQKKERLNKEIMEREYARYLAELVFSADIKGIKGEVQLIWSEEGFWMPGRVIWQGAATEKEKETLASMLEAELGLGRQQQEWIDGEN